MLVEQSHKEEAPATLRGVERTAEYLQKLGNSHTDLILEYAAWVIRIDPEKGLLVSIPYAMFILRLHGYAASAKCD